MGLGKYDRTWKELLWETVGTPFFVFLVLHELYKEGSWPSGRIGRLLQARRHRKLRQFDLPRTGP